MTALKDCITGISSYMAEFRDYITSICYYIMAMYRHYIAW